MTHATPISFPRKSLSTPGDEVVGRGSRGGGPSGLEHTEGGTGRSEAWFMDSWNELGNGLNETCFNTSRMDGL